jgi:hypothetical protein
MVVMRNAKSKIDVIVLLLLISVSAVTTYGYFNRIHRPNRSPRIETHSQIIAGTAPSPYRYRILVPLAVEPLITVLSFFLCYKKAFLLSYVIYALLAIFFLLTTLFRWFHIWFSREQALIGALFVAATIPIALQDHGFQPWSLLEVALFSAALSAIHAKRHGLVMLLLALACLNRETAIFIPVACLLVRVDIKGLLLSKSLSNWRPIFLPLLLFCEWVIIFLFLRYFLGNAPHIETIQTLLKKNLTMNSLFYTVLNGSLFLGVFWVFTIIGFRYAPTFIKRLAVIIPLYLIVVLIWGVWYEVRLLMPLYPILVPLGLSFIYRQKNAA